jgi:hypothetical protein
MLLSTVFGTPAAASTTTPVEFTPLHANALHQVLQKYDDKIVIVIILDEWALVISLMNNINAI